MNQFKLGDKVSWSSQSAGSTTTKTGEIVLVVPPLTNCKLYVNHNLHADQYTSAVDGHGYREHESYVVAVPQGRKARPKLYWPLVKKLSKA